MNKQKLARNLLALLILGIAAVMLVMYIVEVSGGGDPMKHIFRLIASILLAISALIRLFKGGNRRLPLSAYEQAYLDEIARAFNYDPAKRRRLLTAIRYFHEDNFKRAYEILVSLIKVHKTKEDYYAVSFFAARTLTEAGAYERSVDIYEDMIERGCANTTVYSNLGANFISLGRKDDAIRNLRLAIQNDPENAVARNNLAQYYFKLYEYDNAIRYAKEALELDMNCRPAASILAAMYSVRSENDEATKYYNIAVSAGESKETLDTVISALRAEASKNTEEDEDGTGSFDDEEDESQEEEE